MIAILVCDKNEKERRLISVDCRKQAARSSDEEFLIESVEGDRELLSAINDEQLIHLLYYSFQKGQPLDGLRSLRRQYSGTMVMLIADPSVSPLEYLRPGIAPDALMLRPLNAQNLGEVNKEFMESFFERFESKNVESNFMVDTREEKIFIPYSQIYYFEARDKKLYVRTRDKEYAFYDTMDALEHMLPKTFLRCHRSYIVNTEKIQRISTTENFVDLGNQIGAPISRSYKSAFKGAHI